MTQVQQNYNDFDSINGIGYVIVSFITLRIKSHLHFAQLLLLIIGVRSLTFLKKEFTQHASIREVQIWYSVIVSNYGIAKFPRKLSSINIIFFTIVQLPNNYRFRFKKYHRDTTKTIHETNCFFNITIINYCKVGLQYYCPPLNVYPTLY